MKTFFLKLALVLVALLVYAAGAGASVINKPPDSLGLIKGLVGHWSFDEADMAGERAYDRSGNANTGVLTNGPKRAIGRVGQTLSFDGSDDYVDAGSNASLNATTYTLSVWVKLKQLGLGHIISSKVVDNGGSTRTYYTFVNTDNTVYIIQGNGTSGISSQSNAVLSANTWYHIVYTVISGNSLNTYINGVLDKTTSFSGTASTNTAPLRIGAVVGVAGFTDNFMNGLIDDVRVYNRALSAQEVKRLYNIGATLKINKPLNTGSLTNGLVGHWSFDEADMAGERAYDRSGNVNTGTLTNGPTRQIGKLGQALSFDGSNDYVSVPHQDVFNGTNDLTVAFWIRPANEFEHRYDVYKCQTSDCFADWNIGMSNSAGTFSMYNTVPTDLTISCTGAYANSWQHVVGTYDSSTNNMLLYINAANCGSNTFSGTHRTGSFQLGIGGLPIDGFGEDYYKNALIDEVRIYNRALTAEEVKRLYNIGATLKINKPSSTGSLSNGLVGHWSFDEADMAGERAYDRSGSANTGVLTNGPKRAIGRVGQTLSFDGSDDYVDVGSPTSLDNLPAFSISAWVYPSAMGGVIVSKYGEGNCTNNAVTTGWCFFQTTDTGATRRFIFVVDYDGATDLSRRATSPQVKLGVWQHVAVTWDGSANSSNAHIYINGTEAASYITSTLSGSRVDDSSSILKIGSGNGQRWNGLIDDVRVYNRALSAEEVKRLYNIGR